MYAQELQSILEMVSRAAIREDLVVMAIDVRFLIEDLEERLAGVRKQLRLAVGYQSLTVLPYQLEVWRLERIIAKHHETYDVIMEIAKMTEYARYRELYQSISFLKNDTWHWFGLNLGRLPWRIHSRTRDALLHLG